VKSNAAEQLEQPQRAARASVPDELRPFVEAYARAVYNAILASQRHPSNALHAPQPTEQQPK
jgi:hypothetical protein